MAFAPNLLWQVHAAVIWIRDLPSNQNIPCSCVLLGAWQLVFVIESSSSQFCVNHHLHILFCEVVFAAFTWHIRIKFCALMIIQLLIWIWKQYRCYFELSWVTLAHFTLLLSSMVYHKVVFALTCYKHIELNSIFHLLAFSSQVMRSSTRKGVMQSQAHFRPS